MGEIRFLGGARGGRCVYCHDSLSGDVQTCAECSATWHGDCGQSARRCPTVGCSGPPPGAGTGDARPREGDLSPDRPRPSLAARQGPRDSLASSARMSAFLAACSAAFLLWPIAHWSSFWHVCVLFQRDGVRAPDAPVTAAVYISLFLITLCFTLRWLRRIPAISREVESLLDDTKPTAMRLTVSSRPNGKHTSWHASLVGGGTSFSILLNGSLAPDWLMKPHQDTPVLVYGLPPPGPYLIEFGNGVLALVHPE